MAPKILLVSVTTFFIAIFIATMGLTSIALEEGLSNVISFGDQPDNTFFSNSKASKAETHQRIEEKILASTVQVVVQSWIVDSNEAGFIIDESTGHATVMNDSKLVTHNHFNLPLSIRQQDADTEAYGTVELLDPNGVSLFQAPLSAFELAWEDQETLVFAYENEDQFEALGLKAAEFEAWTSLPLQAGMEVAQIDWDGSTTRVDWTTVQEVKLGDGTPSLVLDDGAMPGASGGGIFWQGKHIANNWKLEMMIEGSGDVIDSVTTVALNSAQVAGIKGGILEEQDFLDDRTTDIQFTSQQGLFIEESEWSQEELATVQRIFDHTVNALKEVGLDGRQILEGYRFRRFQGEYVNDVEGALAVIDHERMEIILADTAFLRHQGFNIYHELGHAVDYRLERRLSQGYHRMAGSGPEKADGSWTTADGYWLRFHGQDDREEATADGFALWVVTSQAGMGYPVFYGTPTTVNYVGIIEAISNSLPQVAL